MIEIVSGARTLRISPFERQNTPDAPAYDWIRTYVEYHLPELKTQYQAAFNVGELEDLQAGLKSLYKSLTDKTKHPDVIFNSTENQLNLRFSQIHEGDFITVEMMLRPENPAESVIVTDHFGIDESYFPALLSGLNEIINWPG
ncbi:WapI family immunity protein [Rouxiella sp. Mn2063]|uniref:WapI family immunity protein n=1 Tax=Rouxiella sp. Mn2063 TaxID=3395262 RepID=UPI003BC405E7